VCACVHIHVHTCRHTNIFACIQDTYTCIYKHTQGTCLHPYTYTHVHTYRVHIQITRIQIHNKNKHTCNRGEEKSTDTISYVYHIHVHTRSYVSYSCTLYHMCIIFMYTIPATGAKTKELAIYYIVQKRLQQYLQPGRRPKNWRDPYPPLR